MKKTGSNKSAVSLPQIVHLALALEDVLRRILRQLLGVEVQVEIPADVRSKIAGAFLLMTVVIIQTAIYPDPKAVIK